MCRQYYITALTSEPCLVYSCLTLTQFTANTHKFTDSNTTLILKPGTHTLNSQLTVSNISNLLITTSTISVTLGTKIVCDSFGRLDLKNITFVTIIGVIFQGCIQRVFSVEHFVVKDSHLLGHENISGRAVQLFDTMGSIVNCSFVEMIDASDPENGAIRLIRSNVTIINCLFREINSTNGAICCEHHSTANISECTFYISDYSD